MKKIHALALAVSSYFLVACASNSTQQDEVSFPKLGSTYLKTGAFIEPSAFERIQPGLDRDQVRLILGNPHFNEGLIPKNNWNYAFNFKVGQESHEYITCQYQVQFAKVEVKPQPISHEQTVATRQSLMVAEHWENPTCEALVRATVSTQAPVAVIAADQSVERFELSGDALFAFAGSAYKDLAPAGVRSLEKLVADIKQHYVEIERIKVTGHTDRIGSAASNHRLSLARANTVAQYLASHGIDRDVIVTEGRGFFEPVAECGTSTQITPELVACLQPNRRVVLEIKATRQAQ